MYQRYIYQTGAGQNINYKRISFTANTNRNEYATRSTTIHFYAKNYRYICIPLPKNKNKKKNRNRKYYIKIEAYFNNLRSESVKKSAEKWKRCWKYRITFKIIYNKNDDDNKISIWDQSVPFWWNDSLKILEPSLAHITWAYIGS